MPAISATAPVSAMAIAAYVAVASAFPAKTCWRSTERVRIIFRVALRSSEATMSPATKAVIRGKSQIDPNSNSTSGTARPVSLT